MEFAEEAVEFVFVGGEDEVVGAGEVGFVASEGFLEGCEAGPGVVCRGSIWGDTPEVKNLLPCYGGVQDELDSKNTGGVQFPTLLGLSTLKIVAGGSVVKNEPSGDNFLLMGVWILIFDQIESSERLGELGL